MISPIPDVRLLSPGQPAADFFLPGATPAARFAMLKEVCERRASQGDGVLFHGQATGGELERLDLTKLSYFAGYGSAVSRLLMTSQHDHVGDKDNPDKTAGVSIMLGDEITIENCTLQNLPLNKRQDGALIGFAAPGVPSATLRSVCLKGQDWTFYHWSAAGVGSRLLVEDSKVYFARQGFSQCGNNGNQSHWIVRRTKFFGDASGSISEGATSKNDPDKGGGLFAIVFRAGLLEVEDCDFVKLTGLPAPYHKAWGCPRIAAITDHYYSQGNTRTRIVHRGLRFGEVDSGTASVVNLFDVRHGKCEQAPLQAWQSNASPAN